jgi:hypothetical protein
VQNNAKYALLNLNWLRIARRAVSAAENVQLLTKSNRAAQGWFSLSSHALKGNACNLTPCTAVVDYNGCT